MSSRQTERFIQNERKLEIWETDPAGRNACAIRVLGGGRIEYRYFRRVGRGWNLRSKYREIVEEIAL